MIAGSQLNWPHNSPAYTQQAYANWLRRVGAPWTNAVTSTPDGHPLTITGVCRGEFSNPNAANQVDGHNWPTPAGTWTLIVDDTNPANPIQFSLDSSTGNATVSTTFTEGTLTGGVLVGRTWQFAVARTGDTSKWNLGLRVNATIAGHAGTYPYTATNEVLLSPAAAVLAAPGLPTRASVSLDQQVINSMTTGTGTLGAVRYVDLCMSFGAITSIVDNDDRQTLSNYSWGQAAVSGKPTGTAYIPDHRGSNATPPGATPGRPPGVSPGIARM